MTIHACTIIARNYLAAARVLARSFTEHHPDGTFTTLVIDDRREQVDGRVEPFEVLRPGDLDLEPDEIDRFAAMYDVMEFATSLKPWLLERLLLRWNEEVIYLDPDVVVFVPLNELADLAREAEVVLTPHVTSPIARDGLMIDETHILASGVFNLGFVAIGSRSRAFLEFWKERLWRECVIDPLQMRFVDQRWIDFAPGMFDVSIVRDPGYNVAYWNLGDRDLTFEEDHYTVNGRPLRFFHFSGYNPKVPELLSRHQGERPRILLSQHPTVARICSEYAASLQAEGQVNTASAPRYGYSRLENGLRLDRTMRVAYRVELREAEEEGEALPPNPFEDANGFLEWLASPGGSGPLSRYLMVLWLNTPDLQKRFPSAEFRDRPAFLEWCAAQSDIGGIDYRLVPADVRKSRQLDPTEEHALFAFEPGFRIVSERNDETSSHNLADLAVAAVQASGTPLTKSDGRDDLSLDKYRRTEDSIRDGANFNVNLVCVDVSRFADVAWRIGPALLRDRYTIGLWDWALEEFPDRFGAAFEYVDEVWATTNFARQAIAAHCEKPVFTVPMPVITPNSDANRDREDLGLPPGPLFCSFVDMNQVFERINPLGLLEAFARAFNPGEGPVLIVEVANGQSNLANLERLRIAASSRPDVLVFDATGDDELLAMCDCFVSLHRSDGFDLRMAGAMALGKPMIATAYSGNLDFMADEWSYLVPYEYTTVPDGCAPYPKGARWAEPDLNRAADLLRRVADFPDEAEGVGFRGKRHIEEHRSPAATASFIRARFDSAQLALAERLWILS